MTRRVLIIAVFAAASGGPLVQAQAPAAPPTIDEVVARASIYVRDYVERSSLLVAEQRSIQEIRRPDNNPVRGNLSRANPDGGFSSAGGVCKRQVLRSDSLLVRLGGGGGWMPFRDVDELMGSATYTSFRRFTVNTDDALRKPPLE